MKRFILLWGVVMAMHYSQIFADEGHSNYVNAKSGAVGKLAWSQPISAAGKEQAEARLLVTAENLIIVEGMKQLFAFTKEGRSLWQRAKWSGTPVVLREGLLFYTSPAQKNEMQAVDLNNVIKFQDFRIPNVGEQSYLVLFEPIKNGLIAQVQYPDIPERGGRAFIAYKIRKGGLSYDWSKRYDNEESPILPVICEGRKILLTATRKEVITFDIDGKQRDPEPFTRFPLPFGKTTMWVSCGQDKNLYWSGIDGRSTVIAATDVSGKEQWRWLTEVRPPGPVTPPIITPEMVYLMSRKRLSALKNGKHLWSFEAKTGNFSSGTALADGSILVVAGNKLHRLDSEGKSLFEATVNEPFATYPVIDSDGNIYVASKETLYAFH